MRLPWLAQSPLGGRQHEATCALCREPMASTQALRTFPCLHALHHSCADGLFLHGQESRQWVRCPECRYQLHPDDTGRQMLRRALASSMAAPSPMIQVPALTEGSEVLGAASAQGGATRTPEEVEQLAIQAAERVTQLREELARGFHTARRDRGRGSHGEDTRTPFPRGVRYDPQQVSRRHRATAPVRILQPHRAPGNARHRGGADHCVCGLRAA